MTKGVGNIESADILRPLTPLEVDELLKLYENKYGSGNFHYLLLYNQLKWDKQLEQLGQEVTEEPQKWIAFRKTFYTHRDCDFRKYGTYVSLHVDIMQSVSFHSWEPEPQDLFSCLHETMLIDWKSGPLLTNVDVQLCEQVKRIAESKGGSIQKARRCIGFILENGKALDLQVPSVADGYKMCALQSSDAELIHSLWPHKTEGSLDFVRGLIRLNQTLGVYSETDNKLVAWCFQNEYSGLGLLQVQPTAQRQAFGGTLAKALSKQIAQREKIQLSALTVRENSKSQALLGKIGYEHTATFEWIQLNKVQQSD